MSGGSNTVPGVFSPVSSPSHIGMIIHTTTLDTEDKVKAVYGGTTWILHQGYFLYGAESGATVVPNQAVATGGSKDATLVSHSHSISLTSGNNSGNHTHSVSITSGNQSANHTHSVSGNTGNQSANHTHGTGNATATHFTMTTGSVSDDEGSALSGSGYVFPRRASGSNQWHGIANTGGQSASHTHSVSITSGNNSASHTHSVSGTTGNQSANHTHSVSGNTGANGSSATGANMPPYKNVYIWERTA